MFKCMHMLGTANMSAQKLIIFNFQVIFEHFLLKNLENFPGGVMGGVPGFFLYTSGVCSAAGGKSLSKTIQRSDGAANFWKHGSYNVIKKLIINLFHKKFRT